MMRSWAISITNYGQHGIAAYIYKDGSLVASGVAGDESMAILRAAQQLNDVASSRFSARERDLLLKAIDVALDDPAAPLTDEEFHALREKVQVMAVTDAR